MSDDERIVGGDARELIKVNKKENEIGERSVGDVEVFDRAFVTVIEAIEDYKKALEEFGNTNAMDEVRFRNEYLCEVPRDGLYEDQIGGFGKGDDFGPWPISDRVKRDVVNREAEKIVKIEERANSSLEERLRPHLGKRGARRTVNRLNFLKRSDEDRIRIVGEKLEGDVGKLLIALDAMDRRMEEIEEKVRF